MIHASAKEVLRVVEIDEDLKATYAKVKEAFMREDFGETELAHVVEVINFANVLADRLGISDADRKIILVSSILHDIGRCEHDLPGGHTTVSREHLAKYLPESLANDESSMSAIYNCVTRHSTSSKEKPQSILEKIVFDADNLTIFTVFGVKRWFFKAESWGKSKNVAEAEGPLAESAVSIQNGGFLYLPESREIAQKLFYFRTLLNSSD